MRLDTNPSTNIQTPRAFSNGSNGSNGTSSQKSPVSSRLNGSTSFKAESNGYTNGSSRPTGTYFGHDREEVARILIQSLTDLGYHGAAGSLSRESGYELEGPSVAAFRNAVLQGEWAEAEALLFGTRSYDGGGGDAILDNQNGRGKQQDSGAAWSTGLVLADGANQNEMLFWMRQQKYLELLEARDLGSALMVLRQELTPLHQDVGMLHALSRQSADDLKFQAQWDGASGESRSQLLSDLSKSISPSVMIPEHRLAVLLDQSGVCLFELNQFTYSVTSAAWAPDGRTFVVGSQDANNPLTLWTLDGSQVHLWKEPSLRIHDCAISPDGQRLVAILNDDRIVIWDLPNRTKITEYQMDVKMTCISFDKAGKQVLINMSGGKICAIDVESGNRVGLFEGQKQEDYVIRGGFGGAGEGFVISGSEDSHIYIWRRKTGVLVERLPAHSPGFVNAVAWHPTDPTIFASAGDDHKMVQLGIKATLRPT
ncbi:hypothetical protein B0A49_06532 [Cryomyces minteri]|uniref:CTLH domain-containing protein n=1 Tax=Cryomyces minteri TaxID=331657 RepID=A0A4U0WTV0_9PEZI|nr:hypothetical protein B0A49_06532 [Cryomyces minteri]